MMRRVEARFSLQGGYETKKETVMRGTMGKMGTLALLLALVPATTLADHEGRERRPGGGVGYIPLPAPPTAPVPGVVLVPNPGNVGSVGAMADLNRDKMMVQEAIAAAQQMRFTFSVFKLRAVLEDIAGLPWSSCKSRLEMLLNSLVQRLNDPYLSGYEKINAMNTHGQTALSLLDELMWGGGGGGGQPSAQLEQALRLSDQMLMYARGYQFYSVLQINSQVRSILMNYAHDRDIRRAQDASDTLQARMSDPRLGDYEKARLAEELIRVLEESIRVSDAYRYGGGGGGYPPPPPVPTHLGMTGLFPKWGSSTETVYVGGYSRGSFRSVRLTAQDDSVHIDWVTIVLVSGEVVQASNIELAENRSTEVFLNGRVSAIQEIRVTARSSQPWGTEGRLQMTGL